MDRPFDPTSPGHAPPMSARALPGQARVGRFEIVRVLADTRLSVVYLAVDTSDDAEVVLKEYLPQQLTRREGSGVRPRDPSDAETLDRGLQAFLAEARLLMRLRQPALVQVQEVIEANATAYQVMPHLGGSLLLHVRQEMHLPPDEPTLRVLLEALLDALQVLHDNSELHGAVKPGNILLLAEGRPLLLGPERVHAAIASDLVDSLMATVEPSFAAPEQHKRAAGQPVGAWSDLYSLAETLRFCISGELPPPAEQPLGSGRREPLAAVMRRRYGHLPAVRYSAQLLTALDGALDPNTGARPRSVAEFRDVLGAMPLATHADAWIGGAAPTPTPTPSAPADRIEPAFTSPPAAVEAPPPLPPSPSPARPRPRPPAAMFAPTMPAVGLAPTARPDPRRALGLTAAALVLVIAALAGWWRWSRPPVTALPAPAPASAVVAAPEPPPPSALAPAAEPTPPPEAPAAREVPVPVPVPTPRSASPLATERPRLTAPREACVGRTQFALYRCMQTQCALKGWAQHPQCVRLRATDAVE